MWVELPGLYPLIHSRYSIGILRRALRTVGRAGLVGFRVAPGDLGAAIGFVKGIGEAVEPRPAEHQGGQG